jgi:hypothetical protein
MSGRILIAYKARSHLVYVQNTPIANKILRKEQKNRRPGLKTGIHAPPCHPPTWTLQRYTVFQALCSKGLIITGRSGPRSPACYLRRKSQTQPWSVDAGGSLAIRADACCRSSSSSFCALSRVSLVLCATRSPTSRSGFPSPFQSATQILAPTAATCILRGRISRLR